MISDSRMELVLKISFDGATEQTIGLANVFIDHLSYGPSCADLGQSRSQRAEQNKALL